MRLAFIIESNTDRRLIEELAARYELTVAGRARKVTEFPPRPAGRVHQVVGPGSRARFAAWIAASLAARRPWTRVDAVLVQGYGLAALAANLGARLGGPPVTMLVCNPAERYYRCRRLDPSGPPFRRSGLLALSAVARLNALLGRRYAVLSEHLADVVRGHGTSARITVAPVYGVDPAVFAPDADGRERTRRELGVDDDRPLVFFSSRLAPEKDGETVVRALALLPPRIRLIVRARDHSALLAAAARHGVADRVLPGDMVDPGPQLAALLRAADVVVQASREEGLGFAPLEGLACGTPVVASAVGGLRETIVDGRTGWSCPPGDAEALARCVTAALEDRDEARRRTAAGAAMVAERYAPDVAFARLDEALRP